MTKPQVFIADNTRYDIPVGRYGELNFNYHAFLTNPSKFSLAVLTGGEDINPAIYGHLAHKDCGYPSIWRDGYDLQVVWMALQFGIPLIGICRGAQLLCAIDRGTLVQDCDNHGVWHDIENISGEKIYVSSTHHQMMLPSKDAKIVAWASPKRSTYYHGGDGDLPPPEVEADVVYMPKRGALAVQYHPEYMPTGSRAFNYFGELIETYLEISPVCRRDRDSFISLPKQAITKTQILAEEKLCATMDKVELELHQERACEKEIYKYVLRKNLAALKKTEDAKKEAVKAVEEHIAAREKAKKKAREKKTAQA